MSDYYILICHTPRGPRVGQRTISVIDYRPQGDCSATVRGPYPSAGAANRHAKNEADLDRYYGCETTDIYFWGN